MLGHCFFNLLFGHLEHRPKKIATNTPTDFHPRIFLPSGGSGGRKGALSELLGLAFGAGKSCHQISSLTVAHPLFFLGPGFRFHELSGSFFLHVNKPLKVSCYPAMPLTFHNRATFCRVQSALKKNLHAHTATLRYTQPILGKKDKPPKNLFIFKVFPE